MDIEKANKAIKNAYICGIGWGLLILIFTLPNFAPLDLLGAFVIFSLAFGTYKRSRVCAAIMFILWILLVIDRGVVLVKGPIENNNLFLILVLAIVGIPFVGVLAYFFFQGIRGTFVYHKLIKGGDKQMNESIDGEGTNFFHIPFACELMQKSTTQVLEKCAADFGAELFTAEDISAFTDDMKSSQAVHPEFLKVMKRYTNKVSFKCTFELRDYQAISFVSINFINDTAVECVISLGRPINLERYSSEESVLRVFLVSLEKLYLNGRIQQDYLEEQVYTWKKDNRTLVSFVSHPPSGHASAGQSLGVQIRDTQLHPQGNELELFYNKAQKHVKNLKWVQED